MSEKSFELDVTIVLNFYTHMHTSIHPHSVTHHPHSLHIKRKQVRFILLALLFAIICGIIAIASICW
jgi:hypothetical protein